MPALAIGLGMLWLPVAACLPQSTSTMLENPTPGATASSPALTDGGEIPCAEGGPSEVVQARVVLDVDAEPATWIEIEVQGPEHEAQSACESLVEQALRETGSEGAPAGPAAQSPEDASSPTAPPVRLTSRIDRPCSHKAMPIVLVNAVARLVDRAELDSVQLAMATASSRCRPARLGRLRAVVLRQTGYGSLEQCESVREVLTQARAESAAQARAQGLGWLERAVEQAETRVAAQCGDQATPPAATASRAAEGAAGAGAEAPPTPPLPAPPPPPPDPRCESEMRLLALLKERRSVWSNTDQPTDGGLEPAPVGEEAAMAAPLICRPGTQSPSP